MTLKHVARIVVSIGWTVGVVGLAVLAGQERGGVDPASLLEPLEASWPTYGNTPSTSRADTNMVIPIVPTSPAIALPVASDPKTLCR